MSTVGLSKVCLSSQLVLGWGPSGEDSDQRQGLGGLQARRHRQPFCPFSPLGPAASITFAQSSKRCVFTTLVLFLSAFATSPHMGSAVRGVRQLASRYVASLRNLSQRGPQR